MSELHPATQPNNDTSKSPETSPRKKAKVLAALGGAVFLLAGCSESSQDYGTPNPNATSVTIEDGANVRSNPAVGSYPEIDTLIHKVELDKISDKITVSTPNGVYEHSDADGKWFGISATDLPKTFTAENKDADGIYWINEAKASENLIANKTSVNPVPVTAK